MEQVEQKRSVPETVVRQPMPPVLLFDGVCNFCDSTVQFVFKHDRTESIHFASLQSGFGQEQLLGANLPTDDLKTLVFIEKGKVYTRSSGALRVSRYLSAPWSWAYALMVIPRPIRDFCYRFIAANRYRLFGEKAECEMPGLEMRKRFMR